MRYELTDFQWAAIRQLLPNKPRGNPRVDEPRVLNGIFWVLRSRAPWRDLAKTHDPSTTCQVVSNRDALRRADVRHEAVELFAQPRAFG